MLTFNDMILISCSIIVAHFVLASIGIIINNLTMSHSIEISREDYEMLKRKFEERNKDEK